MLLHHGRGRYFQLSVFFRGGRGLRMYKNKAHSAYMLYYQISF